MENKKYWQSFGELHNSKEHQQQNQDEFNNDLPFANDGELMGAKTARRDFLKYLGFSTAAAAVAASCEMPVKKSIPFVNRPDNITPGIANYFATTYVQNGDAVSIIAKVRDGRPIKIEGNELSPVYKGATSARVQAAVLDLYDTARLRFPAKRNGEEWAEVSTFEAFDKMVGEQMSALNGAPVVLLTSTINSPSTKAIIASFLAKYPGSRHVQYDAVSYSGMLLANEAAFGKRAIPSFRFDKATVVVSLAADFLGTWLNAVEYSKQYAAGRKVKNEGKDASMGNQHFQFESNFSMTGANADERYNHRPSETAAVALNLLAAIGGNVSAPALQDARLKEGVKKAAAALKAAGANAMVVAGSNDVNLQIIVNAINATLGAVGTTIDFGTTLNTRQGIDSEFETLVADLNAGKVGALLIAGANPAYDYYKADAFKAGLKKAKLSVSFNAKEDETTELCQYVIPDHHFLESWGDAEPKSGYFSLIQPTIVPLFKTRAFQDSLLKWSGESVDYIAYLKNFWAAKLGSQEAWDKALQDGVINPAAEPAVVGAGFNSGVVAAATTALSTAKKGGDFELVLYQKVAIGDGAQANNPWLQEMPDPITKATWDNYAVISYETAKELLGIDMAKSGDADAYTVNPDKYVVKIKAGQQELTLPVIIIPGVNRHTVAVALGYGRSAKVGKAVIGVGKNVFPFTSLVNGTVQYEVAGVTIEKTGEKYPVAQNQVQMTYEGREEVVREVSLAGFKKEPDQFYKFREKLVEDYAPKTGDYNVEGTLYPDFVSERAIHWGMHIDLNSCSGCGACVVACNAENNVPVVGKKEVLRGHDMHWIRIDRYFSGDMENPDVIFQPMMCQHCDNAPCENVCPVAATNHSSEGLNQMTYNRCIGTRYCANNCPYKVRRFNWADYTGADSFSGNQDEASDVVLMMNDDLTRMVLNPDVTVRSRGVIEKCSFCVQRLQEAKLNAKKENRTLGDGEAKTACMTACPSEAIVFGNVADKNSSIYKMRQENKLRTFYVLEQIHVLPNVSYMAKVRNSDKLEAEAAHGEAAHHG